MRARLGYLPQEFGFYPHLSGRDMLIHLLKLKGVDAPGGVKNLAGELLERVNLSFAAKRAVKSYSGGMRQRLGIAQAIAGNPRLVIVDEPTAGLDPEERFRFYHLLTELAEDRIVLLSTHIVEDVEATCPRLGVIAGGRLLFDGAPTELLRRAAGRLWQVPAGEPLIPGAVEVTHRTDRQGSIERVVYCASPVPSGTLRRPTLEESYAAFLALQGVETPPDEPEEDAA